LELYLIYELLILIFFMYSKNFYFQNQSETSHSLFHPFIQLILFGIFIISGCQNGTVTEQSVMPNIILIITDDQGYGDLGLHGNPIIQTPTLDSLGLNSTRLTNFYVSPVCAPTRSSLMTGRYSLRTGVFDTYNGGAIMSDKETTIAEYLKMAGYRTGIFGKWHLGDTYPFRPHDQGFDISRVHGGGGIGQPGDYYENFIKGDSSYFNPILEFNGVKTETKGYCSDVFTDLAIEFIQENKNAPFFAYVTYNAPHTPLQVPEGYLQIYDTVDILPGLFPSSGSDMENMTDGDIESARKIYAMVSNIDDNIRKIWETVAQEGISENTLIIFMTDNGPQQRRYNGGLKSLKGSVYEGGIRVPSFWHWPGKLYPGEREFISAHIDVLPTLLDICGIQVNAGNPVDGISLLPVLKGENNVEIKRNLAHYWQRGYLEPYHNIAFRSGRFKLVAHGDYMMENSDFELYDIFSDPNEEMDISKTSEMRIDSLKKSFDQWYDEIMESDNLNIQRIQIGTEFQNPVTLGRNDTKGASAKQWMSDTGMGYWDVMVTETGVYDIEVRFFNPVDVPGTTSIRFGRVQRTLKTDVQDNLIIFKEVELKKGPCIAEAWHQYKGKIYAPIFMEVSKIQ
jgi:arylsulfatase A-like enzyme